MRLIVAERDGARLRGMIRIRKDRRLGVKAVKVGVREFRYNVQQLLESEVPVLVTRRIEVIGIYVPIRLQYPNLAELKKAVESLERLRADVSETGGKAKAGTHIGAARDANRDRADSV